MASALFTVIAWNHEALGGSDQAAIRWHSHANHVPSQVTDVVAFYLLPGGHSTTLRAHRYETVSNQSINPSINQSIPPLRDGLQESARFSLSDY